MELLRQPHCSIPALSRVPIHDKPGALAFNSVSTATQVSLWLNYFCQELNVGLQNKAWIWDWETTLASQVGLL